MAAIANFTKRWHEIRKRRSDARANPQRGQVRHSDIGDRRGNFFGGRKFLNVRMSDLTLVILVIGVVRGWPVPVKYTMYI